LGLLAGTIGLPYFLLSTTSPLIQAWFARSFPNASPYRLFALSNLASMVALVGYPFLVEPWVTTRLQAMAWSAGFAVFVVLGAAAAWLSLRRGDSEARAIRGALAALDRGEAPPTLGRQILWCALAATGSVLLLTVSNHITQNVASMPLLWIAPLSLYLLSFILCFDARGWYRRASFLSLTAAAVGVMAWTFADPDLTHELGIQIGVFCGGLFIACMFCHGELVELKPAPKYLTRFYLMISLGGALGAVLVGVLAPLVLPAYFELGMALVLCAWLLLWRVRSEHPAFPILAMAALLVALGAAVFDVRRFWEDTVFAARNFYGVLRVKEIGAGEAHARRSLVHGTILHGNQYLFADWRREPTTYYTATSGIGRALEALRARGRPLRVGVVGLGTGTLAVYGRTGDAYRFYEINPAVVEIARRDFTYLSESAATIEVAVGDARLVLEREAPQQLDLLAIDAFSSDAIPTHLITREALAIFRRHVRPDGAIAFHVTNRFLDLVPVVARLALEQGMLAAHISDQGDEDRASRSDWMLVTHDTALLAAPEIADALQPVEDKPGWRLWTDDYSNLIQVLE